jgi:hypothetical protein
MRNVLRSVPRFSDDESDKLGEEFIKHEKMIESIVRHHIYKYGGDYEHAYARAVDKLIFAFYHYDKTRSEWEKYLAVQIRYGLKDDVLDKTRRKTKTSTNIEEVFLEIPTVDADFDVQQLRQCLSRDAVRVLDYIMTISRAKTIKGHVRNIMGWASQLGWSRRRMKTAILELKFMIKTEV